MHHKTNHCQVIRYFSVKEKCFSIRELTLLHKALVLPTLKFCCSVWGGTSVENLRKIDRLQSKADRLGIINEYTPIKDIIRISDGKLYRQILDQGENQILHEKLPKSHRNVRFTRKKTTSWGKQIWTRTKTISFSYTAFLSDIMFMFPGENGCSICFWIKVFIRKSYELVIAWFVFNYPKNRIVPILRSETCPRPISSWSNWDLK